MSLSGRPSTRKRNIIREVVSRGKPVMFVLPGVPDDASPRLKRAIKARHTCATTGRCPLCGAEQNFMGFDHRDHGHAETWHESDCDVAEENLVALIEDYKARGGKGAQPQIVVMQRA